jgi:hypothetical protein
LRPADREDGHRPAPGAQKPGRAGHGAHAPPICQQKLIANFTNSELQRYGMDVEGLLADPGVRKFVDWVANKDSDFSATMTKKHR